MLFSNSFLLIHILNLQDVHDVERAAGAIVIPAGKDVGILELALLHGTAEEGTAIQGNAVLFKSHTATLSFEREQTGFLNFVNLASGLASTQIQYGFECLGQETQRNSAARFNELIGVALGADKNEGHGFVPQPSKTAP